jgi:hypothetical protein
MRGTILTWSCGIGVLVGIATAIGGRLVHGNDLWLAYGAAQYLLDGRPPYEFPTGGWPSNALPTVLILVPFVALHIPLGLTGPLLLGLAGGLYAWGVLRAREPQRLLALLSFPAVYTYCYSQWDLLLLAIWLTPSLAPLALVKPHVGWPFGLLQATRWRILAVLSILTLSFWLAPGWVSDWLAQTHRFDGFFPVLGPGVLGLLVLARRRDRTAWLVIGLLCSPVRLWHDALLVFAPIRTGPALLTLIGLSYLAMILPLLGAPAPLAATLGLYLPCAVLVGWERSTPPHTPQSASPPLGRSERTAP